MHDTPILASMPFNVIEAVLTKPLSKIWKGDVFKPGDYDIHLIINLPYSRLRVVLVILRVVVDLNEVLYILSLVVRTRVVVIITVYLNKQPLQVMLIGGNHVQILSKGLTLSGFNVD